jgi:hypothetical protein
MSPRDEFGNQEGEDPVDELGRACTCDGILLPKDLCPSCRRQRSDEIESRQREESTDGE